MNALVKKKWVEKLESGNYLQTTRTLYDPSHGYCCLGVLTDIYLKETGLVKDEDDAAYTTMLHNYSEDKFAQVPNCDVLKWADLTDHQCVALARMNDGGDSFMKIAEYINKFY